MGLGIYTATSDSAKLSSGDTFTNPLSVTFDGRLGGVKQIKLYVRNDDPTRYYTNIRVVPVDNTSSPIINDPDNGFAWKLSAGDTQPTEKDWENIAAANQIQLSDLGAESSPDTSTYLPFWIYIQVPPGMDVQILDHVKLSLTANEVLI